MKLKSLPALTAGGPTVCTVLPLIPLIARPGIGFGFASFVGSAGNSAGPFVRKLPGLQENSGFFARSLAKLHPVATNPGPARLAGAEAAFVILVQAIYL